MGTEFTAVGDDHHGARMPVAARTHQLAGLLHGRATDRRGKAVAMATRPTWVPDRQDIIWIDCNPPVGSEMRDAHPMLVLSPREFNERTSLVIGLPMTTAPYNATNPFAVAIGPAVGGVTGGAKPTRVGDEKMARTPVNHARIALPCGGVLRSSARTPFSNSRMLIADM